MKPSTWGWILAGGGVAALLAYFNSANATEEAPLEDSGAAPVDDGFWGTKTVIGNHGLMTVKSVGNGAFMIPAAADAFNAMVDAAAQDGISLVAGSAFRSVAEQSVLYAQYVARAFTAPMVAKPGTSNHGNGIAVDIASNPTTSVHFNTPEFYWLQANAPGFGFSWAEGKMVNEPWHWNFLS